MQRPTLGHPFEVVLPSGARTTLVGRRVEPRPRDLLSAMARGAVTSTLELKTAVLADANVIEGILAALSVIDAPKVAVHCRNCGADVEIDGAAVLPLSPLLRPLGDPELDPPFDRDDAHELPRPLVVGREVIVTELRLERRTLDDRARLESLIGMKEADLEPPPLPIGAPLLRAMGLAFFAGKTRVKSAHAVARALDALDDDAFEETWAVIARAWDELHYPPRLLSPASCPSCGARHDIEVPARRPIALVSPKLSSKESAPFPSLVAFKERAQTIAREVIEECGLGEGSGLEVLVDDDVPPVDDGGEPLLGSYTPSPEADGDVLRETTSPFTIALYFRSFRAMYDEEGAYDVDAEIRETLEHELEHHLGFLQGDDPLDDEERAEIEREHARIVGPRTKARALSEGAGWLAGDLGKFWRATWPFWLLAVIAVLIIVASSR